LKVFNHTTNNIIILKESLKFLAIMAVSLSVLTNLTILLFRRTYTEPVPSMANGFTKKIIENKTLYKI